MNEYIITTVLGLNTIGVIYAIIKSRQPTIVKRISKRMEDEEFDFKGLGKGIQKFKTTIVTNFIKKKENEDEASYFKRTKQISDVIDGISDILQDESLPHMIRFFKKKLFK